MWLCTWGIALPNVGVLEKENMIIIDGKNEPISKMAGLAEEEKIEDWGDSRALNCLKLTGASVIVNENFLSSSNVLHQQMGVAHGHVSVIGD